MSKRRTTKKRPSKAAKVKRQRARHPVGATVGVSRDDVATIAAAQARIDAAHQALGLQRKTYLDAEARLTQQLAQAQNQHREVIFTIMDKHNIKVSGDIMWNYSADAKKLTRTQ